jgi:hypothetical protein
MIQRNLGNLDRGIRIVAGLALLSLAFVGPHTAWGYVGLIPLLTGVVGFCPIYCPLRLSTCRVHCPAGDVAGRVDPRESVSGLGESCRDDGTHAVP